MDHSTLTIAAPTPELWLPEAIKVINAATTPNDYCKRLTTHPILGQGMIGNHLFLLDNSGTFRLLGGFGKYPFEEDQVFTQFDDQIFAEAANSGRLRREATTQGVDVQVSPAIKAGIPNGALLSVLKPGEGTNLSFDVEGFQEISYYLTLGIFVSSAGFSPADTSKRVPSGEKLSQRQLQILIGIATGKTNLAIAKELLLSESAIKQETVKIFRSLGVDNRRQAAQKAIAMGLVPEGFSKDILSL